VDEIGQTIGLVAGDNLRYRRLVAGKILSELASSPLGVLKSLLQRLVGGGALSSSFISWLCQRVHGCRQKDQSLQCPLWLLRHLKAGSVSLDAFEQTE